MTCMTWVKSSPDPVVDVVISCCPRRKRGFDARTAGAHAGLGVGVVDSARRRPGPFGASGAVPGLSGLDREVAEHSQGLRPRSFLCLAAVSQRPASSAMGWTFAACTGRCRVRRVAAHATDLLFADRLAGLGCGGRARVPGPDGRAGG